MTLIINRQGRVVNNCPTEEWDRYINKADKERELFDNLVFGGMEEEDALELIERINTP